MRKRGARHGVRRGAWGTAMSGTGPDTRSATAARPALLLSEQPMGWRHYRIVALCFLAWIFDFYDLILYSFLMVPMAHDLHLGRLEASFALGLSLLMTALGGLLFGFIGDRFGRRPTIIATVLIYGFGTLLCAASLNLTHLLIFRSLTGIGIGGEWAAGQSLVAETVPPDRRARYAAYVQVGAPLGVFIAAFLAGYVTPAIGWRATFALSSLPALMVAIAVWRWLPESDVWRRRMGGGGEWLTREEFRALRPYAGIMMLLFLVIWVNSEAYWFTYSWMPGYLKLTRNLSDRAASHLMMGMQAGAVAGYASFGLLADRFGRRPVYSAFAAMMAIGLLPPTILWPWAAGVPGLIAGAMVLAGFGTGIWSGTGPIVSELLPTKVRNSALGLLLNVTRGLQFFTPMVIAVLSRSIGFGAALSIGAAFSAVGSMLIWLIPETRGRVLTRLDDDLVAQAAEPARLTSIS
jgi:MFS family permease